MASHRKPRTSQLTGITARTAVTLATAAAASVTVFSHTGNADPKPTPDEVKSQVDALYRQAEAATQQYDGAEAQATTLQQRATQLQQQAARTDAGMNSLRTRLGAVAAAQYRSGGIDPTLQLLTSAHPDDYLQRAGSLNRAAAAEQELLNQYGVQQRALHQQQSAAATQLAALQAERQRLTAARALIQAKLAAAQQLLDSLNAAQRATLQQAPTGAGPGVGSAAGPGTGPDVPVSGRAAAVVAFARAQIGKPYVWGATGPGAYDCSGLTQAAWAAAGVSLPRTTYDQIGAGQRVSSSQLRPGDLVFYYSGISHVGIYVGGGEIVHAPHPGAAVEYAPVGEMPISGAVRPA
ncbi:cell wall-associated NlpC family hydrolase [Streptacidiphilus sp. MAP12-16]|uniref:C40 family peptidase n=1 Tax=Streptacidiphilus sp. MAP12-16 TaxID=3156300 RepID=UPI003519386B